MEFERPEAQNKKTESWSDDEVDKLLKLAQDEDLAKKEIAEEMEGRSLPAIENKLRKVRKARGTYNHKHVNEKYNKNVEWIQKAQEDLGNIERMFEGYSGYGKSGGFYLSYVEEMDCCEIEEDRFQKLVNSFIKKSDSEIVDDGEECVTIEANDKEIKCYQEDVNRVLHRKYGEREGGYDFIDLDPCGSPFTSVPQAIRLIEEGYLAVTYGDLSLRRWGRHNPLMKAYRMPETDGMQEALEYMIGWTMFEGLRQSKAQETRKLEVVDVETFEGYNKGTIRVLYKVTNPGTLNDVMEYLSNALIGFEESNNPLAAKFDLDEFEKEEGS